MESLGVQSNASALMLGYQIGVATAGKMLDAMEAQGEAALTLLEAASAVSPPVSGPSPSEPGQNVNIVV